METTSGKRLQVVVVTPEKAVLDAPADFVALPMYDGELGVLPGRAPLIGRLGFGELRLQVPDGHVSVGHSGATGELKLEPGERVVRYFVDGGFAQVRSDVVTVLTPRAVPAEQIDPQAARQALAAAQGTATKSAEEQDARRKAEERARAMVRVAEHGRRAAAH